MRNPDGKTGIAALLVFDCCLGLRQLAADCRAHPGSKTAVVTGQNDGGEIGLAMQHTFVCTTQDCR